MVKINQSLVQTVKVCSCIISEDISNIENLNTLIKSISTYGVITPIIVEQRDIGYVVLDGRRRIVACKKIFRKEVSAIVLSANTDNHFVWFESKMNQTNFSDMKPSVIADYISAYCCCRKFRGKRTDLIDSPNYRVDKNCGKAFNLSARNVSRYLRIFELTRGLKTLCDSKVISLRACVELSYLTISEQWTIYDLVQEGAIVVTIKVAEEIRKLSKIEKFSKLAVFYISNSSKSERDDKYSRILELVLEEFCINEVDSEDLRDILREALYLYSCKHKHKFSQHCQEQ